MYIYVVFVIYDNFMNMSQDEKFIFYV